MHVSHPKGTALRITEEEDRKECQAKQADNPPITGRVHSAGKQVQCVLVVVFFVEQLQVIVHQVRVAHEPLPLNLLGGVLVEHLPQLLRVRSLDQVCLK